MEKEYIPREAAINAVTENDCEGYATWAIKAIPAADVVPVVRCGECKHRHDDNFCGGRGWPAQLVPDDGYCDRGVRKDGGANDG